MTESGPNVLHAVLVATMRPIAAMLLRFGVGYRELADACKIAFVEVASEEFGVRGRPTTTSRIALMTGLSRKDVRNTREVLAGVDRPQLPLTHLPADVLRVWFTDNRFCDSTGAPKPLTWDGDSESFTKLVSTAGSSLSPAAIRAELLRVGAIRQDNTGALIALRRYFIADAAQDRLIEGIQFGIRPMALTIARNVAPRELGDLRFQRVVDSYSIPAESRAALEQELTLRLRQFSEEIDDLISEVGAKSKSEGDTAVGVGLFYFEDYDSPSSR